MRATAVKQWSSTRCRTHRGCSRPSRCCASDWKPTSTTLVEGYIACLVHLRWRRCPTGECHLRPSWAVPNCQAAAAVPAVVMVPEPPASTPKGEYELPVAV